MMPFIDLAAQQARIRDRIDAAIARVLDHGQYVNGPEVKEFEARLSDFAGVNHTMACANGTAALILPLLAWDVGANDAVFCPSFTFAATPEAVMLAGGQPVFVDVRPDTFCMDAESLSRAVTQAIAAGLTPHTVIAVDLFGQTADYPAIRAVCDAHGMRLIADAAQGFGATLNGRMAGAWADAVCVSFFPAKPLGCYGDGGAVQTNDATLDTLLRSLANHGAGAERYTHERIGTNSRLDTIQAAVLLEKLAIFPEEITARNRIAARYGAKLAGAVTTPAVIEGGVSTWAQYTVLLAPGERAPVMVALRESGIPSAAYYPGPLHRQAPYADAPVESSALPVTDGLAERVLSLPMHPYLSDADQDRITDTLLRALDNVRGAAPRAAVI